MAYEVSKLRGTRRKKLDVTLNEFKDGVNTYFDEARTPLTAVREAYNMIQDQDGLWRPRPGTRDFGASLTTPIDGLDKFVKDDGDGTATEYYWAIDNGAFKYSKDEESWTTVSGVTWTTGNPVTGLQIKSRLYLANGVDNLAYYDIEGDSLETFSDLTTPTLNTPTLGAGLSTGSNVHYYQITAVNEVGETEGSSEQTITTDKSMDNWGADDEYIELTWSRVTDATRYNIYYSSESGKEVYLDSVADPGSGTMTYQDFGQIALNEYIEAPLDDTTVGPKVSVLALSGNRIWGTGDPSNPYRVYWGGVGQYQGAFSPFYGGGWVDIEKGGPERPESVKHYRDGRGTPMVNVFTSDPSGTGSTWHLTLESATVGDTVIVFPATYKSNGQVGTGSPYGVIEANNNIYYPSIKGFYSLGSKPSLLNVLSTDRLSVNIAEVDTLRQSRMKNIVGQYWDGKLLWAVSSGSDTNNQVWVLDLERNSWSVYWDIDVKYFTEYTDTSGVTHLLAAPVSGDKLIEFKKTLTTADSGDTFNTKLASGLIHWDESHRSWARVQYVYVEVARPRGQITFSVSGTQKGKPFKSIGSITITDTVSNVGFGTLYTQPGHLPSNLGNLEAAPENYAYSSIKKRLKIRKTLNNMKWELSTADENADYILMQIMVDGRIVRTGDPQSWKS